MVTTAQPLTGMLVDGQNIDPRPGKQIEQAGQDSRLIPQHGLEGDDPAVKHVVEGADRIFILIKGAALMPTARAAPFTVVSSPVSSRRLA